MALTVVKCQKMPNGETTATPAYIISNKINVIPVSQQFIKRPFIKLSDAGQSGLLNALSEDKKAPTMKRVCTGNEHVQEVPKIMLQKLGSGTTVSNLQTIINKQNKMVTSLAEIRKQQLGAAISSLPPSTIIKATQPPVQNATSVTYIPNMPSTSTSTPTSTVTAVITRPAPVLLRREITKSSARSVTLELIENNPLLHLGISSSRLPICKNTICNMTNIKHIEFYVTMKKIRQNESFALLAEYFDYSLTEIEEIFIRTVAKLAAYLHYLIRWPDNKHYYERHKYMPFAYRLNLMHIQSMIECVETDINIAVNINCSSYKFIYCISTNGLVSYISEAYRGDCDDLLLFEATDFKAMIPNYLTLVSEPGKAVHRDNINQSLNDFATDSADEFYEDSVLEDQQPLSKYDAQRLTGEMATMQTLSIIDGELTSKCVKDLKIPTIKLPNNVCRDQMSDMIDKLREFKILQHNAIDEPFLIEYLNEILVVAAAFINLEQ